MSYSIKSISYEFNPDIRHPLYFIRKNLYNAIRKYSGHLKGKMMDFGCGLKPYENLFSVDEYIGVDFQGEGETYSQQKVDVFYDGKTLPFNDDTFDSVFSSEVFEHIFNLSEIIPEIKRVLKPGGKILITCPFAYGEHEIPTDYARYTSFAMKHIFEHNGFKILAYEKTGGNIEAITQLRIVYWNLHILSVLKNIPVIRSIARTIFFTINNFGGLLASRILPYRQDLYLNNILLAEKL